MIEFKERGILLFSKISSDNNLYLKFLTDKDEILTGLCFGGSTKKKKNIYQIGYFLNLIIKKNNKNFPNSITAELSKPYYHNIFEDKFKIHALLSIISILNICIIEGQKINGIFSLSENIIKILANQERWIVDYFLYLLSILKIIGYDINFQKNIKKNYFNLHNLQFDETISNKSVYFPHHLLLKEVNINIKNANSFFKIFEYVLENHHLINMNLNIPVHYLKFKQIILDYLSKNEKNN